MSAKHTHWGVAHLTNPSGRREGWHLSLHSIRSTRGRALQADLDCFVSLNPMDGWERWHAMRNEGKTRAVKLCISVAGLPDAET